jgi:hypothetical protein
MAIRQNVVVGYPLLADRIGRQPQLGIFRSFPSLNVQDLLYMQAEIITLERDLRRVEKIDSESTDLDRPKFSSDWWYLEHAQALHGLDDDHDACKQRKLARRLRSVLKEYSKYLRLLLPKGCC